MAEFKRKQNQCNAAAFTMIEIIVVVMILSIAALIAVPMMSSAADMQVRGAANRLAADMDYAKNLAITHQRSFTVVFDDTDESYQIQDSGGTLIKNPLISSADFRVVFPNEHSMDRVQINSVTLDPTDVSNAITFDYLGTPYSGTTTANPLNSGYVMLQDVSGNFSLYVHVAPMTGYVTIDTDATP